jgi:hypothetical protein
VEGARGLGVWQINGLVYSFNAAASKSQVKSFIALRIPTIKYSLVGQIKNAGAIILH